MFSSGLLLLDSKPVIHTNLVVYDVYDYFRLLIGSFRRFFHLANKKTGVDRIVRFQPVCHAVDSHLFDLPSIPGIPKFAGFGEITYQMR
jgi:hypothetical protein